MSKSPADSGRPKIEGADSSGKLEATSKAQPRKCDEIAHMLNRAPSLENSMANNRAVGKSLLFETNSLTSSIELLSFDIHLIEYLTGGQISEISTYLDQCNDCRLQVQTMDQQGMPLIAQHMKTCVEFAVSRLPQSITRIDRAEIPQNDPIIFLKEAKSTLDSEISRKSREISRPHSARPRLSPDEQEAPIQTELDNWATDNLGVSDENLEALSDLRFLLASSLNRSRGLAAIQSQVASISKRSIDPTHLDLCFFQQSSFSNSPYITAANDTYKFLSLCMDETNYEAHNSIPACDSSLKKCEASVTSLKERCSRNEQEFNGFITHLHQSFQKRQEEVDNLKKDAALQCEFFDKEARQATWNLIVNDPSSLIQNAEKIEPSTNQLLAKEVLMKSACEKYSDTSKRACAKADQLYHIVSKYCEVEEKARLNSREIEQNQRFEKQLEELLEILPSEKVVRMSSNVGDLLQSFDRLKPIITNEVCDPGLEDEDFSALQLKFDTAFDEYQRLLKEDCEITLKLDEIGDGLLKRVQSIDLKQKISSEEPGSFMASQLPILKSEALCPVCHQEMRDCILSTCLHPFCSKCLQKANFSCPICKTSFKNENSRKFFLK